MDLSTVTYLWFSESFKVQLAANRPPCWGTSSLHRYLRLTPSLLLRLKRRFTVGSGATFSSRWCSYIEQGHSTVSWYLGRLSDMLMKINLIHRSLPVQSAHTATLKTRRVDFVNQQPSSCHGSDVCTPFHTTYHEQVISCEQSESHVLGSGSLVRTKSSNEKAWN